MPLPSKLPTENKDEFVQRCMNDSLMKSEYPNTMQRLAVCSAQATN